MQVVRAVGVSCVRTTTKKRQEKFKRPNLLKSPIAFYPVYRYRFARPPTSQRKG
jgi:hypothetical protein